MSTSEREPLTRTERAIAIMAITLAALAATIFVVVLILGSGGATEVGRYFSPIAIAATVVGLVFAIWAVAVRRLRPVGITTLAIFVPCVLLSALSAVALVS